MSPRLKLMFILTPVTVVVVGGIAGGLWWYQQEQLVKQEQTQEQLVNQEQLVKQKQAQEQLVKQEQTQEQLVKQEQTQEQLVKQEREKVQKVCNILQEMMSEKLMSSNATVGGPESIVALFADSSPTRDPYLVRRPRFVDAEIKEQSGLYIDKWGNPLDCKYRGIYQYPDVWSYGPDGKNGTEDDIRGTKKRDIPDVYEKLYTNEGKVEGRIKIVDPDADRHGTSPDGPDGKKGTEDDD